MFDRQAIALRFFESFPNMTRADLAKMLGVSWSTVRQWEVLKRPVPWERLRYLVITKGITWDWLLEGKYPKYRVRGGSQTETFDRNGINSRFLQHFDGKNKSQIAGELGVTHSAVCSWYANRRQVPWEKLHHLISTGVCTWEWLLDSE